MPRHIPRVWTHFLLPVTAAAAADPPTYQHLQQYHCYTMLPLWRDGGQLCTPCCMAGFHSRKSENNGTNLWGNSFSSSAHYLFINLDLLLLPPDLKSIQNSNQKHGGCVSVKKADTSIMRSNVPTSNVSSCWDMGGGGGTDWVNTTFA